MDRFRNEIKTARMIGHRNVCRMFDLGKENGAYFITMEYNEKGYAVAEKDGLKFVKRYAFEIQDY